MPNGIMASTVTHYYREMACCMDPGATPKVKVACGRNLGTLEPGCKIRINYRGALARFESVRRVDVGNDKSLSIGEKP